MKNTSPYFFSILILSMLISPILLFSRVHTLDIKTVSSNTKATNVKLVVSNEPPVNFTVTNAGLKIEMIRIKSISNFQMGQPTWEQASMPGWADEKRVHSVAISAFAMAKYETSIASYVTFLNSGGKDNYFHGSGYMDNPLDCGIESNAPGNYSIMQGRANYPVTSVSWTDAMAFCDWLSTVTSQTWRLPTEAEWEYAAVGNEGHKTWPWGNTFHTNYCNNGYDFSLAGAYDGYSHAAPVTSYSNGKSQFGIYNLAGNVSEWCFDWYLDIYYYKSPPKDPQGPPDGTTKVIRGGSFNYLNYADNLRCSCRSKYNPSEYNSDLGFRVIRTP